jgi:hypothetical protein
LLKVFVSSTITELRDVREIVGKALTDHGIEAVVYEATIGARPDTVAYTSVSEVQESDVYVGLFWRKYGDITILEYHHARKLKKPCFIYVRDKNLKRDRALEDFLQREVYDPYKGVAYSYFESALQLGDAVAKDIMDWLVRCSPVRIARTTAFGGREPSIGRKSLVELLEDFEMGPSEGLASFLKARAKGNFWDRSEWGLAVDWHVILPGAGNFIYAEPGLWKIRVKTDESLNEESHESEIAEAFGLNLNAVKEIVNSEPVPKVNRPKFYVHDIDETSGTLDSGREITFTLGYTTHHVYRAINKAMENKVPTLGGCTLGEHISNRNLPEPTGLLSRHVFMVRVALHMAVITQDRRIVITRRQNVDITKNTWGLPVSESMKADTDVLSKGRK